MLSTIFPNSCTIVVASKVVSAVTTSTTPASATAKGTKPVNSPAFAANPPQILFSVDSATLATTCAIK